MHTFSGMNCSMDSCSCCGVENAASVYRLTDANGKCVWVALCEKCTRAMNVECLLRTVEKELQK